jgi:hypothetical protein
MTALLSCKKEETEVPVNSVVYDVLVSGQWTANSHPTNYPSNAHFSPIVGMSHNSDAQLFELGSTASEGIKVMAETGKTDPLNSEIDAMIESGSALERMNGESLPKGTSAAKGALLVSGKHALVSVVSMIAPSPDWFIAVSGISLLRDGEFVQDTIISMESYDSGTDSGSDFNSADSVTEPAQPVSVITDPPLGNGNEVSPAVATIRLTRRN